MTDINDLDRHIGRYVDLQDGEDGGSGFLVDVKDEVDYTPKPVRWISFDWGQGFPVSADTAMAFPDPPLGEEPPEFNNPIRAMHLAVHNGARCHDVENCVHEGQSVRAMRALRIWRMKQTDAFWENQYVRKVRAYAKSGDAHDVGDIIRDATFEGAPPHMIDRMKRIATEELKQSAQGQPDSPEPGPDWDPFDGSDKPSGN